RIHADALVARIRDVDVSLIVNRHVTRSPEAIDRLSLGFRAELSRLSPAGDEAAVQSEFKDAVIPRIGNVDAAIRRDRDSVRAAERLRVAGHAADQIT